MAVNKLILLLAFSFFTLLCAAQTKKNDYEQSWRKIDSLINKTGQAKTASKEVAAVYTRAKKEGNDVQLIKALIYRANLSEQLNDDDKNETFSSIGKEIASAKGPARSILQSILAAAYYNYRQRNRYKFYSRTSTVGFINGDPATWSLDDLNKKISSLYLASISGFSLLKATRLEPFDAVIIKGNTRLLRPTLYDLLAHRALDYFKTDENDIVKPSYSFELRDSAAFADASVFSTHRFLTADSTSSNFQALLILQRLTGMHLHDSCNTALLDVDLERIQFVHTHAVNGNKDSLYKDILEKTIDRYPGNPAVTQAMFLLADWYANKAANYDPLKDTADRYAYNTARELCDRGLKGTDSSEGRSNCANLLSQIMRKELNTEAETVNVPGQPFRLLLTYRNVPAVYFRIILLPARSKQRSRRDTWTDDFWQQLLKMPSVAQLSNDLPDTKDHQHHRVECKIGALPVGDYALVASASKDFSLEENSLALQYFYVSNIAYVSKGNNYYVLDRQTGAPLPGADVQVWKKQYDYQEKQDRLVRALRYTTDKNGAFTMHDSVDALGNSSRQLEVKYGKDLLFINEDTYSYVYAEGRQGILRKAQAFLFTDRSIYRPGQLLYFKGIMVNKNEAGSASVLARHPVSIKLYDANNQAVDSLSLVTNDFGSCSGTFTLPTGQLNGMFYIRDEGTQSQTSFRVEEYKRPKFSVEIKKPTGVYRLEDTIRVEGLARSYSGSNVDGAPVNYRVTRKRNMPYYGYAYSKIWPPYNTEQMEIAHGTTRTDSNGKFTVVFKAIADRSVSSKSNPIFNYEVAADVTDVNGETRSGTRQVGVGATALKISLNLPQSMRTDSLRSVRIATTNMNDIFENTRVTVTMRKLQAYPRIFRERYWEQPDQFIMTRQEYYSSFPLDPYSNETDMTSWPTEKKVYEASVMTSPDATVPLNGTLLQPGWYAIEVNATDTFHHAVKETRYIELYGTEIASSNATTGIEINKDAAEAGDRIRYRFLTNLDSVYLIHELIRPSGRTSEIVKCTAHSFTNDLTVAPAEHGTLLVDLLCVKNNRVYANRQLISIASDNKKLTIGYTSFRDKTMPGVKETWKINIHGHKGEKDATEILTSMYDASLDQFNPHSWQAPALWYKDIDQTNWATNVTFKKSGSFEKNSATGSEEIFSKRYDALMGINETNRIMVRGMSTVPMEARFQSSDNSVAGAVKKEAAPAIVQNNPTPAELPNQAQDQRPAVQPRTNLQETAFFFPDLHTDSLGNVEFTFTTPEALTAWKWMLLAHTRGLAFGYGEKTMITQKQLMVQPNAPRFLRAGDRIDLSTKVVNLSGKEISGSVSLHLTNALTGNNADTLFHIQGSLKPFTIPSGQSVPISFSVQVPKDLTDPVSWRIIAESGSLSDGEEAMLPVVSNRMLVTETLPLPVRGSGVKNFILDKLLESGNSPTLKQNGITVEFTSNPAWYAVQALPYLSQGEKENAEQVFSRYYANALATKIAAGSPRFLQIVEQWTGPDTAALISALQKNEALRSVLLQETPWVLEARSETQQKKNIALLFDMNRMSSELQSALIRLKDMQAPTGGFVWFKGGPEDRYMTQYILSGIGHLQKLGALSSGDLVQSIITAALSYLDNQIKKDYDELKRLNPKLPGGRLDHLGMQYLYMRSFFANIGVPGEVFAAYNYYRNQSKKYWVEQNSFVRGMIALSLFRTGDKQNAQKIMRALRETAITSKELGTYWKDMTGGYYWYQAPVETQALLIEAFSEITSDSSTIDDMKTWLLKNKQTTNWKTSKATADACYALLLQGSNWMNSEPSVKIALGDKQISSGNTEAGTGFFRQTIPPNDVTPSMGHVSVQISAKDGQPSVPCWGSVYWQYFEDLDKITGAATPLQLVKKIFVEKNTDRGPVLQPLDGNNTVHVGDKLRIRIELRSDRQLEYVHMKDMRASCLEPVNVLSEYKWQGGLGYFETTRDASTDFFFSMLPEGVYVFEYSLYVMASGSFSNGVASIQCFYAPEFSSHSEGLTLQSQNK